jgi:hypothetical protein
MYRRADNSRPVSFTVSARVSLCYELISSAETSKRHVGGGQCTDESDHITSKSELLLRQNSVTAHEARRLASDHCATEIHRPKSAVRPIYNKSCWSGLKG